MVCGPSVLQTWPDAVPNPSHLRETNPVFPNVPSYRLDAQTIFTGAHISHCLHLGIDHALLKLHVGIKHLAEITNSCHSLNSLLVNVSSLSNQVEPITLYT